MTCGFADEGIVWRSTTGPGRTRGSGPDHSHRLGADGRAQGSPATTSQACSARVAGVADQVSRVGQAGPVVAGDAVEKTGCRAGSASRSAASAIWSSVARRPAHRHDDPVDARPVHDLRLADVLGIVAVDRREGDDRLDPLACDECRAARPGVCQAPPDQPPRHDHAERLAPRLPQRTRPPRADRATRTRRRSQRAAAESCFAGSSLPSTRGF